MASYNKVVLVGNLTRDPALKNLSTGSILCEFGIAVNESYKKDGQKVESVHFFDVTCWGRQAEIANQYLGKGSQVLIEGSLKQDRWESDGVKRSKISVNCQRMVMLGKPNSQAKGEYAEPVASSAAYNGPVDDDIPF